MKSVDGDDEVGGGDGDGRCRGGGGMEVVQGSQDAAIVSPWSAAICVRARFSWVVLFRRANGHWEITPQYYSEPKPALGEVYL